MNGESTHRNGDREALRALEQDLTGLLGSSGWFVGKDVEGYGRDWLNRYGEPPIGVARPSSVSEVSRIVAVCRAAGVAVTPQGGNTSLCGAAVSGARRGVILSLQRMNRIGQPDVTGGSIEVEAGAVLANLHHALEEHGYIFPMHLGAEGTAQIGGLLSTNAGGSHALRYGMMQDLVMGLEVVLPDGAVWNGLRHVQKDNAGYQLRKLFCGAEGTLGIVTRAVLRIFPAPRTRTTALLAVKDVPSLLALGTRLRGDMGEFISGLEFFCDFGLALAERHVENLDRPFGTRAGWYLLVELTSSSPAVPLHDMFVAALEDAIAAGEVVDGTIAASEAQRAALWRLREEQPEGQRLEGPQLKHDIAVPPGSLVAFIDEAGALCDAILPGVRINPFGHLGDGNIHYNLTPPAGAADFGGLAHDLAHALARLATDMGGSFAAEHGLGRSKIALADAIRSPVERQMMARIKAAFDPENLMNPGVILRSD